MMFEFLPLIITVVLTILAQRHGPEMLAVLGCIIFFVCVCYWSRELIKAAREDRILEINGYGWKVDLPLEMLFDKPERPDRLKTSAKD